MTCLKLQSRKLSEVVEQTLAANNMDKSQIDWLVPHQANLRIIAAVARKLDLPMEQVVINLDRYGNTSAATVPTALDEAIRDGRIQRGQTLLLGGLWWRFRLGFSTGEVLISGRIHCNHKRVCYDNQICICFPRSGFTDRWYVG